MPRFVGHPSLSGASKPFHGPGFDEADVSDKPRYIRGREGSGRPRTSLRRRCEAILTVDWVARRAALPWRTGRLDDTLLLFTADNGTLLGEHRLVGKHHAYATPVPMYAMWPASLGLRAT